MRLVALLCLMFTFATPVWGANWPHWRGPAFNGSTDEKGLPSRWSETENMAWIADLPGPSGATPIVWEDRIFRSEEHTSELQSH